MSSLFQTGIDHQLSNQFQFETTPHDGLQDRQADLNPLDNTRMGIKQAIALGSIDEPRSFGLTRFGSKVFSGRR